jgi:hypothetical protein
MKELEAIEKIIEILKEFDRRELERIIEYVIKKAYANVGAKR